MDSKRNRFSKVHRQLKKRSKKSLLLTVVALIEIIAIMGISTYSWVESVSSIMIHTTGQDVATGTKMTINNPLKQIANVGSTGNAIDLTNYFRKSGGYHLTAASSADGNTMYFPEVRGGNSNNFRIGTINDKNVNYISFTFKLKSTDANYTSYAFNEEPVIKLGGTAVNNNLVRVSFGVGNNFSIYGKTAATGNVVNATNGGTGPTVVRAFSDYVKGKNRLFSTTYNTETFITVSIWIQDPAFSSYSSYNNKALTIEKFRIVPVRPFTLKSVYMNNGVKTLGSAGGTVAINDGDFGATATGYVTSDQTITLKATANTSNGYEFLGFATTQAATLMDIRTRADCNQANSVYSYTYTVSSVYELFAHFSDEHVLYLAPEYKHNATTPNSGSSGRYAAYIWGNINGQLKKEWYVMSWDSSTNKYKLTYKGSANSVIFCYMDPSKTYTNAGLNGNDGADGWADRWLQTFDLTFPQEFGEYTYRVTSRYTTSTEGTSITNDNQGTVFTNNKVFGYWDQDNPYLYANVQATTQTGGSSPTVKLANSTSSYSTVTNYVTSTNPYTVKMDGTRYVESGNANVKYEAKVVLSVDQQSVYDFNGWYLNDATTPVSTDLTATVQIPENATGTLNYQARFTIKPDEYYVTADFNNWTQGSSSWKMSGPTSNEYTKDTFLDPGDYEFKIYERIHNIHYSNGYSYHNTYLGASDGDELNTDTDTGNMKLNVPVRANYTFHFNSSTHKFWLTISDRVTCYLKGGTSTTSWPDSIQMTYDAANNYYYGSKQVNGNYYFKIYFNDEYYGNGYEYHDTYLGDSGVTLTTSGNNMHLTGSNKTYYFHFNPTTKKFWLTKSD